MQRTAFHGEELPFWLVHVRGSVAVAAKTCLSQLVATKKGADAAAGMQVPPCTANVEVTVAHVVAVKAFEELAAVLPVQLDGGTAAGGIVTVLHVVATKPGPAAATGVQLATGVGPDKGVVAQVVATKLLVLVAAMFEQVATSVGPVLSFEQVMVNQLLVDVAV